LPGIKLPGENGTGGTRTVDAPAPRKALLSAFHPEYVVNLALELHKLGYELWATDGTKKSLDSNEEIRRNGIQIHSTAEITGIASWFGGRVKTLHPGLHSGLLAPHDETGLKEVQELRVLGTNIQLFDILAVDPYPFPDVRERARAGLTGEQVIKLLDVGGPTMKRGAAKNHKYVTVISDLSNNEQVNLVLGELRTKGEVSDHVREYLAKQVFVGTAAYDVEISDWMSRNLNDKNNPYATPHVLGFVRTEEQLRYGENPHQEAGLFRLLAPRGIPLEPWDMTLVKGKGLSYSNLLDVDCGANTVLEFTGPAVAVTKHAMPIAAAKSPKIEDAMGRALATDPRAAYGCGIAINVPLSLEAVKRMKGTFVDILAAPGFEEGVLKHLNETRPKLKVVQVKYPDQAEPRFEARSAVGRLMVQRIDQRILDPKELVRKTDEEATPAELETLDFAWRVVRHARSNAVVLAHDSQTVGVGNGASARVVAVHNALEVAGRRAEGAVLASDGFLPFKDSIEAAAAAGVRAVIQPGGSLRDQESIDVANEHKMAMYFTGWRVFKH
jgi:phosphoribosylaminoimidazolecarboxamide formyltransferase/IMP cyclohydrolase